MPRSPQGRLIMPCGYELFEVAQAAGIGKASMYAAFDKLELLSTRGHRGSLWYLPQPSSPPPGKNQEMRN